MRQLPCGKPFTLLTRFYCILNFFMHSFNSISLAELPVTPIMFLLKLLRQFLRTYGRSRSGSIETKMILSLRQAPSGRFLMIRYMEEMQKRVLGVISGQLVQPKQTKQQYPDSILLENGYPSLFTNVQSPPTKDYLSLTYVKPFISSSKQSICYLLLTSATQTIQISAPNKMANPITLTLVTPEYDFWSSSDYGEELMAFCYCIIQASSLFLGMRSLEKAKE